ncbi:hypothetical protein CCACVL1_15513 [Corchorus capsularis]|uniref:Uncharacterized protein n=1 Tax=Corchorus capsularis TaxID=210143 RepID=A0A1R3I238_COCAP|nr:hypothetical protein CCACVL1_15513 [Corchorus capsularis]
MSSLENVNEMDFSENNFTYASIVDYRSRNV